MADEGYGEFSGGGSVDWTVRAKQGNSGIGHDDRPKGSQSYFRIRVNGRQIGPLYEADGTTIRVEWGSETNERREKP